MTMSRLRLLKLEPRVLFDGAAAVEAVQALDAPDAPPAIDTAPAAASGTPAPHEIAFIDPSVPDADVLAAGLRSGVDIVRLDPSQDPFAQIGAVLSTRPGTTAVHLLSHGNTGELIFGGRAYTAADLQQRESEFSGWRSALSADADILLYGCDVAGGQGTALVDTLAQLTGADVAASTDATGLLAGGDWTLEYGTGAIEADSALTAEAAATYGNRLSTVSLNGTAGWVAIMFGTGKDPDGDSQAGAADTDIIGDATHGSLYTAFSDNGTASGADDYLYFRLRIDNPTSSTNFGGVAIVGLDANRDGRVDLFISVDGRNNTQAVRLLDPGTGANLSPNTTTTAPLPTGWLANNGIYPFSPANYSVNAVTQASDPNWSPSAMDPTNGTPDDLSGDGHTDVFVSWRIPVADIASVLARPSPVDRNGVYGPRGATGIQGFTKDTVVQYVSFTQTQPGPINGDLNGVPRDYDKNLTFAALGAFTTPMSASNPVPASTGLTITDNQPGTASGPVVFTFTFTEGVGGFDAGDISLTGGTAGTFTAVDATTYRLEVTPDAGVASGNIVVSVSAGAASSLAGGLPSSAASATQAYDTLAPSVSIDTPAAALSGRPVLSGSSDLPDGSLVSVMLDTDNNVATANVLYQVIVSGGLWVLDTATVAPVSGALPSGGLTSYTRVTATATDAAGNSSTAVELNRPTVNALTTSGTPVLTGTWTRIDHDVLTVTVAGATYTLNPSGNDWTLDLGSATPTSGTLAPLVAGHSYDVTATVTRGADSVTDTSTAELTIVAATVRTVTISGGDTVSGINPYPTISGTSLNAGGYVIVRLDPGNDGNLADAVTYSVTTDGSGNWSLNTASAQPISGSLPSGGYFGSTGIRVTDSSGSASDDQVLTVSSPSLTIGTILSTASADGFGLISNTVSGVTLLNVTEDNSVVISGTATNGYSVNLLISDASGNSVSASGLTVSSGSWTSTGLNLSALNDGVLTVRATLSGTDVVVLNTSVTHDKTPERIFINNQSTIPKSSAVISGTSSLGSGTGLTITIRNSTDTSTVWTGTTTTDASGNWSVITGNNLVSGASGTVIVKVAPTVQDTDTAGNITQQAVRQVQAVDQTSSNTTNTISITSIAGDAPSDVIDSSEISPSLTIVGTTSLTTAATSSFVVTVSDGSTTQTATIVSNVSGTWTATLTAAQMKALNNGELTVTASVKDASNIFVYDVELPTLSLPTPVLTITDDTAGNASGNVTFTFTFSEAVTGFTLADVNVTGGTPATLSGSGAVYTLVVTPTANTSGNIAVTVADGAATGADTGRASKGATTSQPYNTTAAAAPPTLTLDASALASDGTPLITGTTSLSAGAPVIVVIDPDNDSATSNSLSYSVTVQPGGSWSLDVGTATPTSGTLPTDGLPHYARVVASATNAYGNTTSVTAQNAPSVDSVRSNQSASQLTGTWTALPGDTLSVVVNGVTYSQANGNLAIAGNHWSLTTATLADGTYGVTATTTRGGVGVNDVTSFELVVDTAASVSIDGGAAVLGNDARPVISGQSSDIEPGAVLTLSLDPDANGSYDLVYRTTVRADGSWSVDLASAIPYSGTLPAEGLNGSVPVRASATDAAGNVGSDTQTRTVDQTPPVIAFTSGTRTPDTTPLIRGATDLTPGTALNVDIDPNNDGDWSDAEHHVATVQPDGSWSVQTTGPLSGTVNVRAAGTDDAGNSTVVEQRLTVDPVAPTVTVTPVATANGDFIADQNEDDAVLIAGTTTGVADHERLTVVITDGNITISDTVEVVGGAWQMSPINLSALSSGTLTVTATHVDASGNAYSDVTRFGHDKSAVVAIESISLDTGVLADFVTTDRTVDIRGSATPGATVGVVVRDSGGTVAASFSVVANAVTGSWSTGDTSLLPPGVYTLEATVGGTTVTQALTLVDATPPTLVASTPADNASAVPVGSTLSLTFSKDVRAGSGFVGLYRTDGTLIESFDVSTGLGDAGGTLAFDHSTGLTLDPGSDLDMAAGYYVKIDAAAVIDSAGNAYAGIADATTLNFSTPGAGDVTPPVITGPAGSTGATASVSVDENQSAVHTFGADEAVTWRISGGADAVRFAIDASGNLSFVSAPDYEVPVDADADNDYVVVVEAEDGSGNVATQVVTVSVLDLDEAAPVITGPSGSTGGTSAVSVDENQSAVHRFTANETVTWRINGGADAARFAIDGTGNLSFVSAPDYETPGDVGTDNDYEVVVEAEDGSGNLTTQTVTVTVRDVDETAPLITGPSGSTGATSSVSVDENQSAVHRFTANETVTWRINGGADAARFVIDGSGNLSFVSAPDYETPGDVGTDNDYEVVVEAEDGSGNLTTQTVTVTVRDVDETAPLITGPSGSTGATSAVSVDENQSAVHRFTANETVTWRINGGADAARFAIDASGNLRFVAAPDYELPVDAGADNQYEVVVEAEDGSGHVSSQTVTVSVRDVNESSGPPDVPPLPPAPEPTVVTPPVMLPPVQTVLAPTVQTRDATDTMQPANRVVRDDEFGRAGGEVDPRAYVLAAVGQVRQQSERAGLPFSARSVEPVVAVGAGLGVDPSLHVLPAVARVASDIRSVSSAIEVISAGASFHDEIDAAGSPPDRGGDRTPVPAPAVNERGALDAPLGDRPDTAATADTDTSEPIARRGFSAQLRAAAEKRDAQQRASQRPGVPTAPARGAGGGR